MAGAAGRGRTGLLTVFIQHTSASLTIQENADPDVVYDLNQFFGRIVPEDNRLYRHTAEGPDDMPAHIRAALTLTQLSIPVDAGPDDARHVAGRVCFRASRARASPLGGASPDRRIRDSLARGGIYGYFPARFHRHRRAWARWPLHWFPPPACRCGRSGSTGAQVSILAFGGGSRFVSYGEEKGIEVLNHALDLGHHLYRYRRQLRQQRRKPAPRSARC